MTVGALAAFASALGLAGGALGLGRLAGRKDVPGAAVVGLHLMWWPAALAGVAVSPGAAAGVVLCTAAVGLGVLLVRSGGRREALALAAFLGLGAPLWLAPPVFYDALVYHLGMPWSWLENGSMAPVPHNLFSHFPLAASVIFLGPVRLGLPEAAAGLHWASLGLAATAAAALARRLGAGRWAWAAAVCTGASWHGLWIAGVAAVDQFVVLAVAVGAAELAALVEPGRDDEPFPAEARAAIGPAGAGGETEPGRGGAAVPAAGVPGPHALAAGLALGLALAVKYTAAVPVAALLAAFLLLRPRRLREVVTAGGAAVLSSSFWYARNLVTTGNPVYPLFWGLLGGRGWTAADDARYLATVREGVGGWRSLGGGLVQLLDPSRGLGWWLPVAVLLALPALWGGRREARLRWLGAAVGLTVAGWLLTSHTTRYALVLGPLVGALAARGLAGLGRVARVVAVAGLLLAALSGVLQWGAFTFGELGWLHWLEGPRAAEAWRHRVTVNDPIPAYRAADRLLPPGARLLVVAEGRSWGCPRPHQVSSAYDTQLLQEVVEAAPNAAVAVQRLEAMGFSHLLVNWGEYRRLHGPPFWVLAFRDGASRERFRDLMAMAPVLWREDGLELRELP